MPTSIRSCRIGLLGGLLGACVAVMAASPAPEPDGSPERPYPHLRLAAVHVVETARSALADRGEPSGAAPLVTVAHTRAVSPELVDAVRDVFSGAGERQSASGAWLEVILETQNSQQSGAYTPAPRAGLEQADLVLALDEAQAASGLTHVRGALLTLRASGLSEQEYGAGEIVPGSATSVYVQAPDSVGLVVRGEGYCNRSFPSGRWRYSAFKAAEVDAAAALARAREGATVRESSSVGGGRLEEHSAQTTAEGFLPSVVVVSKHFDPSSCRAVVTLTDTEASPGERHDADHEWFLRLRPLFSLVSIFF